MKCVLLIAVFCVVPCAFQNVWDEYDTWYDDFNNLEDDEIVAKVDTPEENLPETIPLNKDDKVDENDYNNNYGDYEIEDNRDEIKSKLDKDQETNLEKNDESAINDFDALQEILNNNDVNDDDGFDENLAADENPVDLNVLLPENINDDKNIEENVDISNEGIQQEIENINKETQQILENIDTSFDNDKDDDVNDSQIQNEASVEVPQDFDVNKVIEDIDETVNGFDENKNDDDNDDSQTKNKASKEVLPDDIQSDIKDIIEETRQILEQTHSEFDEDEEKEGEIVSKTDQSEVIENNEGNENLNADDKNMGEVLSPKADIDGDTKNIQQTSGENNDNEEILLTEDKLNDEIGNTNVEDTVDKVYEDLNADLDKLFETWQKLSDDDGEKLDDTIESIESSENNNKKVIPEEANADDDYGRDQDNIGDEVKEENNFDYEGEAEILALRQDYYDSIVDKDLSKLFEEFEEDGSDVNEENKDNIALDETGGILYGNDALIANSDDNKEPINKSDSKEKEVEDQIAEVDLKSEVISDDAKEETTTVTEYIEDPTTTEIPEELSEHNSKPTEVVEDLSSAELQELSSQFGVLNHSDMEKDADDTPIHITLNADEPVVITSPNYPNAYPTDISTIDWILEGLGMGIEVNLTDLQINSAMGHYLMIKPGQIDASGDEGIVFAYRINHERRYRFRNVNKMLVRFHPVGGMSFSKGFQLSAKIIEAPVEDEASQDMPEPEYLVPEPQELATLFLAGHNSTSFEDIREEFRRLLADMATMYINANDIDPGMNVTSVVTQITRTYVCNVNWPDFHSCVTVTFGIPLTYGDDVTRLTEEELLDMWKSYSGRDPFAARLSSLGISDYIPPKDSYVLTLWVVLGSAVFISTVMLAFVLWRYSCVENYTRMVEDGDTDSIHDKKRGLDMYPTPHQTLPPLYTENDYKWADGTFEDSARVDMGGFANNTFTRDEISDDSEDEVAKRDRNVFQPRDFNAA